MGLDRRRRTVASMKKRIDHRHRASFRHIFTNTRYLQVPSDSPRAIEILLHIIHHNTRQIPCAGDIEVDDLFHVAVAVDMYDLSGCLGLWAKSWSSAVAPVVQATSINVDVLTRLSWIAWVFGDQSLFQCVLSRLVMEVGSDEYGELVDAGRWELRDLDFVEAMFVLGEPSALSLFFFFFSISFFLSVARQIRDSDILTMNRPPSRHSHELYRISPPCPRIRHPECCQHTKDCQSLLLLSKYDSDHAPLRLSALQSPRGLYQCHPWLTLPVPSSRKSVSLPGRP